MLSAQLPLVLFFFVLKLPACMELSNFVILSCALLTVAHCLELINHTKNMNQQVVAIMKPSVIT